MQKGEKEKKIVFGKKIKDLFDYIGQGGGGGDQYQEVKGNETRGRKLLIIRLTS